MKLFNGLAIWSFAFILMACPPPPEETCTDGLKNQNETGIDCGGECAPCFDCNTDFCAFLSGARAEDPGVSSLRWKCSLINGEVPVPGKNPGIDVILSTRMTFKSDGKWSMTADDIEGTAEGTWVFDDPDNPTEVRMCWIKDSNNCSWTSSIDIISLKMGELVEKGNGTIIETITWVHDS